MNDWKETAPGRFERPIDSLESFYIATANVGKPLGTEHLSLSFGVQIEHQLPDIEAALKRAWTTLRFDHPKLAATVEGPNLVYQAASDAASISAFLSETFIVQSSVRSAAELFPSLNAPPPRAVLYYLPASSEIVVHTSHWRMDGIGGMHFLSLLLDHLTRLPSTPLFGSEVTHLTPGLDTVLSLPAEPPELIEATTNNALVRYATHLPSIGLLPATMPPVPSLTTHRQELAFSEPLSEAIVAATKVRGMSVTVAAHAALISATKALQAPENSATNYASWCAFSLRDRIPGPYTGGTYAVAGAHTGWPLGLVPAGFTADADALQRFYQDSLTSSDTVAGLRSFHNKLTAMLSQPLPPGVPVPAHPALNSLGVVDRYIQHTYGEGLGEVQVQKFWLGNAVMALDIWVHFWSWKGQITFSALHNVGVYDDQKIRDFLEKIRQVLVTELGVKEQE